LDHSAFSLKPHVTDRRELREGDPLDFTFQLLDVDAKRMHYFMTLPHRRERRVAATYESISMRINMHARRRSP